MRPIAAKERIEVLDVLRGFAIFGIILADVDITFWDKTLTGVDHVLNQLHGVFVVDKFWPLFSFLFGLGFALQLLRAETRGARFLPVYLRRLFILLLFGLANLILLLHFYRGDVLHIYASLGFLLLLFRSRSPRTLLVVALVCLLLPRAQDAVATRRHDLRLANPATARFVVQEDAEEKAKWRALRQEIRQLRAQGTYRELTVRRTQQFLYWLARIENYYWWVGGIFPMFLLGLWVGRRRIFENLPAHLPFIRKVFWWGLGLGLVGQAIWFFSEEFSNPAWPYFTRQVGSLVEVFSDPALSFFYASSVILLAQREAWKKRLAPLAAVGRMALTNYLFQAVVFALILPSYGLGLYSKLTPLEAVGLALLIFATQTLLSMWWLRRFRFGPAEWLWRTLTYGKLQPMRVRQIAA
jgi:uncharacterized protein